MQFMGEVSMKLMEQVVNKLSLLSVITIAIVSIVVMIWITVISFQFLRQRKDNKLLEQLNSIPNDINVGILYFTLETPYRIFYANKCFYDLLGYDEIEAKNINTILDLVHPNDNSKFKNSDKLTIKDISNTEVTMTTKDGNLVYLLFNGNIVQGEDGKPNALGIVVDITKQQQLKEKIILERERYRVATELSNDVIFEYDFKSNKLIFTSKIKDLLGHEATIYDFGENYIIYKSVVHPDDQGIYLNFCQKLLEGSNVIECEIRLKHIYGEFVWCQMVGKTIYDNNNQPVRVIGKMVNVDVQKKELEHLTYKATRDPLTGIYNKEATVKKIENFIYGNKNGKHILMFIDLDDFKEVNDNYGHLVGDKTLTFMVKRLKSVFGDGEIIGRIGGDEFVVFIGNIDDMQEIINKANRLIDVLNTEYKDKDKAIPITGSVGIALYPRDGLYFDSLLERADEALYRVKKRGKNNFVIYGDTF